MRLSVWCSGKLFVVLKIVETNESGSFRIMLICGVASALQTLKHSLASGKALLDTCS